MNSSKNATVAKIRAVYGKRLREKDYNELFTKKKVTDAAEFLKRNTHFSSVLSGVDTTTIHRGHLESILNKAYFDEYERLCRFQQLSEQPFFNFLLVRSEIRELLKAILYLNNERSDAYIQSMHAFMIEKARFDMIELAKAEDFNGLLKVIRNTPYYYVLRSIRTDKDGNIPYTQCEILLRTFYLEWMLETIRIHFDKKTTDVLSEQINVQADIINIINGYRMKKYFNGDAQSLKEHSLPFHGRLSKEKQDEVFEADSPADYIRRLSKTVYGRLMENLDENMEGDQFEKELEKLRCSIAKRALQFSENAAVSLYSYMYLAEVEIKNIITVIESIRYGKNIQYMKNLVVQT
ncbi:MAG: hypothetical protein E7508_08000 [Ruminococcus sp.]|nr:hypothetical protein [Ruminococcus sp.]